MDASGIAGIVTGSLLVGGAGVKALDKLIVRSRNGNGHHAPCAPLIDLVDKVQDLSVMTAKLVAHREDDVKSQVRIEQTLVVMSATMTEAKDAAHQAARDAAIVAATVAAQAHMDAGQ